MLVMLLAVLLALATAMLVMVLVEGREPRLTIDPQRLTLEETRLRRAALDMDDDPEFRAAVKRRMTEGMSCAIKPWYEGKQPTQRLARRSVVVPMMKVAP